MITVVYDKLNELTCKQDTCSNYIDKYLPIQIHRELCRFLMFTIG